MQGKTIITAALVAAAAIAAGPATGATAKASKETKLTCGLEIYAQGAPNPSGIQFGFASCPKPFGDGVHHSAYTVTPPTATSPATIAGTFKNYYNRGTASGTFALTVSPTGPGAFTYTGTVTYTGGTAKFRHVRGAGTITCTSTDNGAHKACTVNSTLRGI